MPEAVPRIRYGWLSPQQLPAAVRTRSSFGSISVNPKFYSLLEKSVREEGFRNPILLDNAQGLRVVYGESRGWVAIKLGIPVPAFVNDYRGQFQQFELIENFEQAVSRFKNRPAKFRFGPPLFFFGCKDKE